MNKPKPKHYEKIRFGQTLIDETPREISEGLFDFVQFQHNAKNADNTPNNTTVYFGDAVQQPFELRPYQQSDNLRIDNLRDIFARTAEGTALLTWRAENGDKR